MQTIFGLEWCERDVSTCLNEKFKAFNADALSRAIYDRAVGGTMIFVDGLENLERWESEPEWKAFKETMESDPEFMTFMLPMEKGNLVALRVQ